MNIKDKRVAICKTEKMLPKGGIFFLIQKIELFRNFLNYKKATAAPRLGVQGVEVLSKLFYVECFDV